MDWISLLTIAMNKKWFLLAVPFFHLSALPQNPVLLAESAEFVCQENNLTVHAANRAIINWDSFSIDSGEEVRFIQPAANATVLNRVVGNDPSSIFGRLQSNGQIILLNNQGILFDATSQINTGSFIASSFDLMDDAFHNKGQLHFQGNSRGSISFHGQIDVSGDFYALSDCISQEGPIRVNNGDAGFFALGKLTLGPKTPYPIFERTGSSGLTLSIQAQTPIDHDSQFHSYSGQLCFLNSVHTTHSIFAAGTIVYLSESADLTATRMDGGGEIYLGGVERGNSQIFDRSSIVILSPGASVNASAAMHGDGGKVVVWSQRNTEFHGLLDASGGKLSGNGGFIEVSSLGNLGIFGTATTEAPSGTTGTFLIDPVDVTISSAANSNLGPFIPAPPPPVPGQNYSFTASPANILNTALQGLLAANNVLVDTNNGAGGTGNITVLNNVSWASANSLFLTANGSINIRALVENTGGVGAAGNLTLTAGTDVILDGTGAGATVLAGTRNGIITVNATRDVIVRSANINGASATIGTTAAAANNAVFNITAGNNIQLTANPGAVGTNKFALIGSSSASANTGAMTLVAGNDLIMTAGTTAGSFAAIGASGASNSNRPITITIGRDLSMSGGSGATSCFASIGSAVNAVNAGTVNLSVGRNGTLQGGNGAGGYVLIGGFGQTSRAINMTVLQDLSITGGVGGSGAIAPFAAIGSFNNGIAPNGNIGDITVNVARNLNITAGTTTSLVFSACAGIMRAGEGTGITSFTSGTNFNVNVGNNLTMTGGTTIPNTGSSAYIGFGGFRIQGAAAATVNKGNININVGHNLEMISSSGDGAAHIVGGTQRQCQGDVVIKVGENFYMHNLPSGGSFLGNSIGGSGNFRNPPWLLNFYVTVGKSLTIDSRNNGFNTIQCFNNAGDYLTQGFVQFHIGGDLTFIGGNQNQNDAALIWLHPNQINEIWVGGNWRAYNGINATAGVQPNVLFNTPTSSGNIGRPDWRAGGNIVVAGGVFTAFGPDNILFTTSQPIYIEADAGFLPGQLWAPQSVIVNGSNIFTGTPLAANSTGTSTVAPFHGGGDRLGAYAIDTNLYDIPLAGFPTTVNGPTWSTANPVAPVAPFSPGFLNVSYTVGTTAPADLTILSKDFFDNATPADFTIGTTPQYPSLRSVSGDIFVEGFRDTTLTGANSAIADAGSIAIDTVRDLIAANSTTTAGTDIHFDAGRNINFNTANMVAGVNFTQQAEDSIFLTDSNITAVFGNILSIAGNDSSIFNSLIIGANDIDWVIDNDNPVSPLIGNSSFSMDGTSVFNAAFGHIRIYTALQNLNSISPLAQFISNGVPYFFTPGTLFQDSNQEQWCIYYPNGALGIPFRIYYKNCLQAVAEQATIIVDENLVDLHPYNEFPGWMERFWITYEDGEYSNIIYIRRRHLNVVNHPKSYTHLNIFFERSPD